VEKPPWRRIPIERIKELAEDEDIGIPANQ